HCAEDRAAARREHADAPHGGTVVEGPRALRGHGGCLQWARGRAQISAAARQSRAEDTDLALTFGGISLDLNKLSNGEKIIGVSGILLVIFSFFDWFKVEYRGLTGGGGSAWDFTLCWLAVILGIVMLAIVVIKNFTSVQLPELGSVTWAQVLLGLGGL